MIVDLKLGDCLEVLKTIPDNSVDSVVTDPPYGLGFMGKEWDTFDKNQFGNIPDECSDENVYNKKGFKTLPRYKTDGLYQFANDWAKECFRVLKPGGHLLSFAGSRTYHKICMGIEDAGFEIRDQIMWVYGSGFPKSHNIGKAIDKIEGNEREDLGYNLITPRQREKGSNKVEWKTALEKPIDNEVYGKDQRTLLERMKITKGNSDWEGWGTALKPAHEPIVMARKPLSEKSIAENVLKHGTGGINIDGSRIEFENTQNAATNPKFRAQNNYKMPEPGQESNGAVKFTSSKNEYDTSGRFPANIIFECICENPKIKEAPKSGHWSKSKTTGFGEFGGGKNSYEGVGPKEGGDMVIHTNPNCPCYMLDEQSGVGKGQKKPRIQKGTKDYTNDSWGLTVKDGHESPTYNDMGGASRFFYCAKASKKDRNEGLVVEEEKNKRPVGVAFNTEAHLFEQTTGNSHPTVKPTDLMRYLINLVTPPNGTILDPFMGSGSTGKAAVRCGVNFIGIEKEQEYMNIASARIEHERNKPTQTKLF